MNNRTTLTLAILVLAACAGNDHDTELEVEYRSTCAVMATEHVANSKKIILGREGWVLVNGELEYLGAGSFVGDRAPAANPTAPPEYADPTPAILDFHRQLAERGINLIVVPIPVRPAIYPEAVLGSERFADRKAIPNLDSPLRELISRLREQGVQVIDLAPRFLKARRNTKRGPLYLFSETHWTPYGVSLAARAVADELKDKPWYGGVPKLELSQRWVEKTWTGGAYRALEKATGVAHDPDPVQARRIIIKTASGPERLEMRHPNSPVVVMGDSNTIWWKRFQSSLPHQLAFELGFPVDVLSTKGGGANETRINLVRHARSEPTYLESKRVVIWCFSARAFTNTREGWIPIPL